ncbi:MAG: vWA domain-containing protein [Planctomycetota bacterium]
MSSKPRTAVEPPGTDGMLSESETGRAVKRIVPWVVSVGIHGGLIGLGFLVTWTVVSLTDEQEPTLIVAEFDALSYDPVVTLETDPLPPQEQPVAAPQPSESFQRALAEQLADLEAPVLGLALEPSPTTSAQIEFAPAPGEDTATFVGMTTSNARRIVYVIDASGSMIRSLQIVIEELTRSLGTLSQQQSYGVIFFQRNDAVMVPPTGRLTQATVEAQLRTLEWIDDHVIPAGRSNPLAAIERALSFKPNVIFLLSENITGSGEFEIDQDDLLKLLEELNPIEARIGRRRTQINCIQFLDPDPLDTLRRIADRHGGPGGYRFLSRAELGLTAP